jgi:5-(carboxyamino)imidazole ribonucleotide synthase
MVTVVGVIGGGQLARMMIPAAINLGLDLRVFAEAPDSSAQRGATHVGDFTNFDELEAFSTGVDVITFDHEHVPLAHLSRLRELGTPVFPPPQALALTHDKTVMRRALSDAGLPQPRWSVATSETLDDALSVVGGFPCVAKLPVGGYDGKGVRMVDAVEDFADWLTLGPVLLEERVDFVRELAQLSARRPSGQFVPWLPVETRQEGGVCAQVLSPAPGLSDSAVATAQNIAKTIAETFDVVGVLAVELFETTEGSLLVNELAMRPHNSGHVLTEQSVTSQFEQHLRAVCDYPLGSTALRDPHGVMVNVFSDASMERYRSAAEDSPEIKFHSYQKSVRAGRKAGHLVLTGRDPDDIFARAMTAWELLEAGEATS